jgi:hypothetical protein
MFFWLDPKEPKNQGKPEASGRFAKPRLSKVMPRL